MKIEGVNNFTYEEFFPEEVWEMYKNAPVSWISNLINPKLPRLIQFIRERFGKALTINDWSFSANKNYNYSGFRQLNCPIGAKLSRHKLGVCADIKIKGMTSDEIREDMIKNYETIYKNAGLTVVESNTPTWVHCSVEDTTWRKKDGLWIIAMT